MSVVLWSEEDGSEEEGGGADGVLGGVGEGGDVSELLA